jgi:hypothetical protein
MSVKEAREILGDTIKNLSDDQVIDLIRSVSIVCDEIINIYLKDNNLNLNNDSNYN